MDSTRTLWRRVIASMTVAMAFAMSATPGGTQQMQQVTFVVVNNLFSTPAYRGARRLDQEKLRPAGKILDRVDGSNRIHSQKSEGVG